MTSFKLSSKYARVVVSVGVSSSLVLGVGLLPHNFIFTTHSVAASNTYNASNDKQQNQSSEQNTIRAKVTAESGLNLRKGPSLDSERFFVIPNGTIVEILEEVDHSWLKVKVSEQVGYVFSMYIKKIDTNTDSSDQNATQDGQADWEKKADAIIKTGLSYEGAPYKYAAKSGSGYFDCSLFTQTVFAAHGIDLPRDSRSQYSTITKIEKKDLRKGDLVFFSLGDPNRIGHVAIYIGEDKLLHASSSGVNVTSFEGSEYYSKRYKGAGRVIE